MRRALGLLLLLAACAKVPEPPMGRLQKAVGELSGRSPCDAVIPLEWAPSWPVPTAAKEFKVFFYPLAPTSTESFWLGAPLGEASFILGGAVTSCRRLPGEPRKVSSRRWAGGLSVKDLESRRARLFALTEAVAAQYAARRRGPEVAEYRRLFAELSEPDLQPYYQALNPDFWAWASRR